MHHLSCSCPMHLVLILRCQSTTHACRAGGDSKFLGRRGGENEPRAFWLSALYSQKSLFPPVSLTAEGWWKEGALSCLPPFVECPIVHLFACLAWGEKFSGSSGVHIMGSFGHVVKWRYRWSTSHSPFDLVVLVCLRRGRGNTNSLSASYFPCTMLITSCPAE